MTDLITFEEAICQTQGQMRSLLLGNGFSGAQFSYNNLLGAAQLGENSPILNLFNALCTVDFEYVIWSLQSAAIVEKCYGNYDRSIALSGDATLVRHSLVEAIKRTHPEYIAEMHDQLVRRSEFLSKFSSIFSLNYDLILYWALLHSGDNSDGFGLGKKTADGRFQGPFQDDAHCKVYNLHGGLHLFLDEKSGHIFKALNDGTGVISTIEQEIMQRKRLPLYVAEGHSSSKMTKINSVKYLRRCYEMLTKNSAPIFIYGHRGDDSDSHIYEAIFKSNAPRVYYGVYNATDDRQREAGALLAFYSKRFDREIPYTLFASESANI